jgi:glutathione synthase/RimK-type ligase-like ATP-grasp enzyme
MSEKAGRVRTMRAVAGTGEAPPTADDGSERTPRRPRLVIPYDITSSSPMAVAALLTHVCDIVWVVDSSDPSLGAMARLLARLGVVIDTNGLTWPTVVDDLRHHGVDGVVAFTDSQVLRAALIAETLGLAHNPPAIVERLVDKHVQRAVLAHAGVAVPRFRMIPDLTDGPGAAELVSDLRFPVVLKPLRGDSSRNVITVADHADLTAVLVSTGRGAPTPPFVVEEFIPDHAVPERDGLGGYVSVECIVDRGVPVPVAVTGKFPLVEPFREAGNFMPHPLQADEAADVIELAVIAAHALGVQTGALHIEIKLTSAGPRLIEVNGRIGGGAIDALFARRFGFSLTELAARIALGQDVELTAEMPTLWSGPFLYEFFVQPPVSAVRFVGLTGGDAVIGTAGAETMALNRSPGDGLDWTAGSQGYVMQVSGVAGDRAELAVVPDAVATAAGIRYEHA